jgi:D-3-phosphoglycerate dehydrogenase
MDAAFSKHMLYIRNDDRPGFVGKLGNLLGDAKINIATFSMGRMEQGGEAVCIVSVDEAPSLDVCAQIKAIEQVKIVDAVSF